MADLVTLASQEGQVLLTECVNGKSGSLFQPFTYAVFNKQVGSTYCGIQSAAICISSYLLGKNSSSNKSELISPVAKSSQPVTEESLVSSDETVSVLSLDKVNKNGMSLSELHSLVNANGFISNIVHAKDCDADKFRKDAIEVLSKIDSSYGVIVNYHMATLGQEPPFGHHSPLAAYHALTDRFLIMDTWKTTEASWAKTQAIYKAMNTIDDDSNLTRGYCIVTK